MRNIFVPGTARFLQTCSAAALMLAITAVPAAASSPEAAPQDQGSAPQASDNSGEIVVTASRREERAMDVPVAVTAVGGEKLGVLNSSGLDIRFLSARTPSLLIESSFGRTFPRFYIRGLGNTDFDPNVAQPVAIYYDDVVLENPMLKSFPVFDVASVEVLRGPQGTLFGRNTPAGVVKIDSAKPSDTYSGYGSISYGTFDTVNAEAAVGGPIGGGFTFRLSGMLQRRDNWVENVSTVAGNRSPDGLEGYRDLAGRFQLGYENGDFKGLLNVHGRDLDGTARIFRAASLTPGTNRFVPGFDVRKTTLDADNDQNLKSWGANLHLEYSFPGIGTLYSVTGYETLKIFTTSDIDGGDNYAFFSVPPAALPLGAAEFPVETGNRTKPKEFSQELRFATEDMNGLRLQGGGYYFHQSLYYEEYDNQPGDASPAGSVPDGTVYGLVTHDNTNQTFGVFASAEYQATDKLSLRAGLRYSHDKKHDFTDRVFNPSTAFPPMTFDVGVKGNNVSWDASATYKASEGVNFYARVATGYQGPAIEDRVTFDSSTSTAPAEKVVSLEAGIKTSLLDKKVRFDLTGYWYRVKDFQQTSVGGGANTANLISIDKVTGYGLETDLEARPIENLVFTASGSYNHTEIKDPGLDVGVCGGGCTVLDPINPANGNALIDGNPLPQAQKWIANATLRYAVPVNEDIELFGYADVAYRSSANIFLYDSIEFKTRPFTELGLKAGAKTSSNMEVAVFVRNLLDQIRVTSAVDFNNITTMVNEPRTWGVSLSKRF
ncbi:TonB-dependent receptor [Sphingobium sp. H39-3-25]|uniref:TonB-dependent receptor n=1 Tax=Sphingobium arseniciresistens TaxID=3030834 RepID=UPI0023B9289D|nr:TonB-dependent receptor [Sphingobium arseniciresistens]